MERLTVTLGERSYPITIAAGLFNDPASFLPLKSGDQAMLVTNETPVSYTHLTLPTNSLV